MTREVDGHFDLCTQGPHTTTGGDRLWWDLRCSQMQKKFRSVTCKVAGIGNDV